ncbi:LuxR family transcriptional regulator [Mycobacterium sp. TY814]|uniref:LuxR family transcriptional regulator n=1 Tax=unclassified Mycobacterium TaxID=2642494 RepID=UPI002740EDD3|nr:LuxR family transcriptional regulator [Mycobacterium sp. TY814]MDP7724911.1 LuxR family transcriptional regulator [Mycobacterium sp. TY814]
MKVGEPLPFGTVTWLLAEAADSTRLWRTDAQAMNSAVARLDHAVCDVIDTYGDVRRLEQGEAGRLILAFARPSDAVAAALDLQRAPLSPIELRIALHTAEVRARGGTNDAGLTVDKTARLRDLAHGGQTVMSAATESLILDRLPAGAWLTDLGTHRLRDIPRAERVVQLSHPDVRVEFPPLRSFGDAVARWLPTPLTSFVGRGAQIEQIRGLLAGNRLVTLTGTGGVGKSRLAAEVAAQLAGEFSAAWYVDLAPVSEPELAAIAVARALGLHDQPGSPTLDSALRYLADSDALLVLDNCEHLLDAVAAVAIAFLDGCPEVRLLATSREPLRIAGEVNWRVPPLSLADEAVELFNDRARRARPDFRLTEDEAATVARICAGLDGVPLAIELAAARVRALTLDEIADGLSDRFRLLTGSARTSAPRQQTLWASVDWSYRLLTGPEQTLFRRIGVFVGCFSLDAAQAVAGDFQRHQVLDGLTLLVDKSLVVAEDKGGRTCFRLLETVRHYALEKLAESGELDRVRQRHRDYYVAMAASLEDPAQPDYSRRVVRAEIELGNLRAAFLWSSERAEFDVALTLASSLLPVWIERGRVGEGRAWFGSVFGSPRWTQQQVSAAVQARALADKALLDVFVDVGSGMEQAELALQIARKLGNPGLQCWALTVHGLITMVVVSAEQAATFFAEAIDLARGVRDRWRLSQILTLQAVDALLAGCPVAAGEAGSEGLDLADEIGYRTASMWCRWCLAFALMMRGELAVAVEQFTALVDEAEASHEVMHRANGLQGLTYALAHQGKLKEALAAADGALEAAKLGGYYAGMGYSALARAALAAGDVETAKAASEESSRNLALAVPRTAAARSSIHAQVALASGDLETARRWSDHAVQVTSGRHLVVALLTRARVAMAEGRREQAERDAYDALASAEDSGAHLDVPEIFECLAILSCDSGAHVQAARLFGMAETARQRQGSVRFVIDQAAYDIAVQTVRDALSQPEFDGAWAEGASMSSEDAIGYGQRGQTGRKRPAAGWDALTPSERDVARLVTEGLSNKDVGTRLFISPRTVQTHLTHIYAKLGIASRVQLVQQAVNHGA